MALNRITRGRSVRRALILATIVAALAGTFSACGGGDGDSAVDKDADVQVLNEILARQLAAVDAYGEALPALRGAELATAREFLSQEQEHVDATTKALRGLDGEADPPDEPIEVDDLETRRDALAFLYGLESATIDIVLDAVGELTYGWPRPLLASMATNQAQRLVLIRRMLGAGPSEWVPEAFETGETDAPEEMVEK
jgi:hypothetical protein